MRVLIDACVPPQVTGGVQQFIEGLAAGFALNADPSLELTFLTSGDFEGGGIDLYGLPELRTPATGPAGPLRRVLRRSKLATSLYRTALPARMVRSEPLDDSAFDVVHLPHQMGYATQRPHVYSIHDLQHLHLPEFFTREQRRQRKVVYKRLADDAAAIVVMTDWTADDVSRRLGIERSRVHAIPLGVREPRPVPVARGSVALPPICDRPFALYPAQTWRHKNHIGLLECLAYLAATGETIPLVCTGHLNEHFGMIQQAVRKLGLTSQVRFLGYVSDDVLEELYRRARCVVFPSLFEGWGMPIFDAMVRGVPVAATDRCGLGQLLGDAAATFDPRAQDQMSAALARVWSDEAARSAFVARGKLLTKTLTWERTAASYAELYRSAV